MNNKIKRLKLGYLFLQGKVLVSDNEFSNNVVRALAPYATVKIIPFYTAEELKRSLKEIRKYGLDYLLLIDNNGCLIELFILREALRLNIPIVFVTHTFFHLIDIYACIIPLIRDYDVVISPSQYGKKCFNKISDKINVSVIPHCLNINYPRNVILPSDTQDKKTITFLGRLTESKGLGELIECMPEIIKKVKNAHLHIIGPLSGDSMTDFPKSSYARRLEKQIIKLKLTKRVHFEGFKSGIDKYVLLSKSDVFVNPTTAYEEVSPVVNIEALLCGVPIVATDWAGNRETVKDGMNGYLVKVNYNKNNLPELDRVQLISLTAKLLKDKKLNLKMRKNIAKDSLKYNYHKVIPQFINLLMKNKRKIYKISDGWDIIRKKTPQDFRHLYNKYFLFFLKYFNFYNRQTYSMLYEKVLKGPQRDLHLSNLIRKTKLKNTMMRGMLYKLYYSYRDYILLRKNN